VKVCAALGRHVTDQVELSASDLTILSSPGMLTTKPRLVIDPSGVKIYRQAKIAIAWAMDGMPGAFTNEQNRSVVGIRVSSTDGVFLTSISF
jgi:hypothetical protein